MAAGDKNISKHILTMWTFSTVVMILKKNYTRLCRCLPPNYNRTISALKQLVPGLPAENLTTLPSVEQINEAIVSLIMCGIREERGAVVFCQTMDRLCDDVISKQFIESLRQGKAYKLLIFCSI